MAICQRFEDKKEKLKKYYHEKSEKIYSPLYTSFVEKEKNIDRFSTLYSFEGPFELLHADIGTLDFWQYLHFIQNVAYFLLLCLPRKYARI